MIDQERALSYDELYAPDQQVAHLRHLNGPHRRAESPTPLPRTQWSARDLLAVNFPEPRWAVKGLVSEGLNMLAGSPKVGKSWASLGLSLAIASGGRAFGRVPVERGEALVLSLEDPPRRLQRRLQAMLLGEPAPRGLDLWTECDRLPDGAAVIERWLDAHPGARLVVVDVWARLRPALDAKQSVYEGDYLATRDLKRIADERGVAVMLVHHTRKMGSEDWLDTISGSNGLAGACDGVMVLRRSRGAATAELMVTGRDVEESKHALEFDPATCAWQLLDGPVEDYELAPTRRSIMGALREHGPLSPAQLGEILPDLTPATIRQNLKRMVDAEQLDTDGNGHYFTPLSPVTPVTTVTDTDPERDARDDCDALPGVA